MGPLGGYRWVGVIDIKFTNKLLYLNRSIPGMGDFFPFLSFMMMMVMERRAVAQASAKREH